MHIRREQVEARLQELEQQMGDLNNQMNAVSGAIQDCKHWLQILGEPEPDPPPATKSEMK